MAHPPFPAVGCRNIRTPRQLDFFDDSHSPMMHVSMGYYYELVTTALFGGQCQTNIYKDNGDADPELIKPDVVTRANQIFESKANRTGHQLLLLDSQIDRYRYLQIMRPFPKIYFVIYRHRFANVKSFKGGEMALWKCLSSNTVLGVIIPFSIVTRMHDHGQQGENPLLTLRYDNPRTKVFNCVRVRSPFTNSFYDNPDAAIASIGLEPKDFFWRRWSTPKITIDGQKVDQFPMVMIHDADHGKWSEQFSDGKAVDCPF